MPGIVFSRTLEQAEWNTVIMREVDVDEITVLKARPGGDLAPGGADLAASFMRYDLIDEYRVYAHPALLGRGKPLFPASDTRTAVRPNGTRTFGNGVVLLCYERPTAAPPE
ncbi:dihydrofolate reductase family protein [Streptomyces sp. NPDC015032]|uniref:dihydrofolate reductase family protein n=1 Tax=Streptomyces sp. NPDC015032 TaxID=3364937 RepID=UPI0036F5F2A5